MNPLSLILCPHRPTLAEGPSVETHVLIRVQAPLRPSEAVRTRPSLHLALVLDRSGSMDGRPFGVGSKRTKRQPRNPEGPSQDSQ